MSAVVPYEPGTPEPEHAHDLEAAVLGALMLERDAWGRMPDTMRAEVFDKPEHRLIFQAMAELRAKELPLDKLTVVEQLRSNLTLPTVGGAYYVATLTSRVASAANIEHHCYIILQYALKRFLPMAGQLIQALPETHSDPFKMVSEARRIITRLEAYIPSAPKPSFTEQVYNVVQDMHKPPPTGLAGYTSGFSGVDGILNGWQPGKLAIVGGWRGTGKTALALHYGWEVANRGIPVLFISLEMEAPELIMRLISNLANVPHDNITKKNINETESKRIIEFAGKISKCPLKIDDNFDHTNSSIKEAAKKFKQDHGDCLIIVDNIPLIKPDKPGKKLIEHIPDTCRDLKKLAKSLSVPVIALHQLNSEAVKTQDKRPQGDCLWYKGETHADIVQYLYRPEKHGIMMDSEGNSTRQAVYLLHEKNRNGRAQQGCDVCVKFEEEYQRFSEWNAPALPPSNEPEFYTETNAPF